jgi:tripartite-type tricarboxylate transporter receptor subunit TctC
MFMLNDLRPVARYTADPTVLAVRAESPWKSVQEFVDDARKRPGAINYGSSGNYGTMHVPMEILAQVSGSKLTHIPFTGAGPAVVALLGGQIDLMFNALIASAPHIRAGRVRALALTGGQRDRDFPQVPTLAETVPGAVGDAWFGLSVPARTPPAVVERLRSEMSRVLNAPETRNKLAEMGMQTLNLGPREFQDFVQQEIRKWGPVIKAAQIKAE